ncbi:MAG: type II toxin-antitoxin system mRNA interferase toxin, RelE/StbE family [Deltaproteobacteria bacterium]|jgi:addiction module RelE/StbE family toxin|nr:type II toxin-antitoxin system mRNA interferase toxin, RelE/StbE family [Deltaproteobacteria bacterium]MBT4525938.1 type II toxin-antitoxin system mRNA interferase toxin, RelE/StbE family [Deltaproteobacteria bacterium]
MEIKFEEAFLKALKKHASIKKAVKKKVDMIIQNPVAVGEPLKGNWQGFYSSSVKRNFIIIYLFCEVCRKKGDDLVVQCSDCKSTHDQTIKFILLGPHNKTYGI